MFSIRRNYISSIKSHLIIGEFVPRLFAVAKDLPQNYAKAPYIRLHSEGPVHDAFWGHPANW